MLTLQKTRMSEEEFMRLPDNGRKYELVDGEVLLADRRGGWSIRPLTLPQGSVVHNLKPVHFPFKEA